MEEPRDHTATDASTSCDIDDRAVEVSVSGITSFSHCIFVHKQHLMVNFHINRYLCNVEVYEHPILRQEKASRIWM